MTETAMTAPEKDEYEHTKEELGIAAVQADPAFIDKQIATAKKFPRTLRKFVQNTVDLATVNRQTMDGCWYTVPRAGKKITGPSIRLAEIMASQWGNLHIGTCTIGEVGDFIEAEAIVWDLENNNKIQVREQRRIVDKDGRKYGIDMIGVTGKAAQKIALRNAIMAILRPFLPGIEAEIKARMVPDAKVQEERQKALDVLAKQGVNQDRVLEYLDRITVDQIDSEDIVTLRGLFNACKEEGIKLSDVFSAGITVRETQGQTLRELMAKHTGKDGAREPGTGEGEA